MQWSHGFCAHPQIKQSGFEPCSLCCVLEQLGTDDHNAGGGGNPAIKTIIPFRGGGGRYTSSHFML